MPTRRYLSFDAPGCVSIGTQTLDEPRRGELRVQTRYSAMSPGTEGLVYRGEFPPDMAVDESLDTLSGEFRYPLEFGYASAGTVSAVGEGGDRDWLGRRVFAFAPHASVNHVPESAVVPLPEDLPLREATFLANLETAVSLVMDASPVVGERVAIFGQGPVGLLTTALLGAFPLEELVAMDPLEPRRQKARELGADSARSAPTPEESGIYDAVIELSGQPAALNRAISCAGYDGRVIVGSWYGTKCEALDLGRRFHRDRIRLISSQVSTLPPHLRGRFTKERRMHFALRMAGELPLSSLVTHEVALEQAADMYALAAERPEDCLQTVFCYEN